MDKKRLFCFLINRTGMLWLSVQMRRIIPRRGFLVLCYHRVLDIDPLEFGLMHGVVDASVKDFDAQMKFLSKYFNVMSLSQLISRLESKSLPANSVAITFDDAYKDVYTNALPILKKYGLPATIFACSDYISSSEKIYWWERLAYIVKNTKKKKVSLKLNGINRTFDLLDHQARLGVNKELNAYIKETTDNEQRENDMDNIEKALDVSVPESVTKDLLLDIKDIKEMLHNGIEVGSHTITHPNLVNCTSDELKREIVDSKVKLEEITSSTINTFAYPSGIYDNRCKGYAKEAGYKCACAYDFGINNYKTDLFEIKRIDINSSVNIDIFKTQMVYPKFVNYSDSMKYKKVIETEVLGLAKAIRLKGWEDGFHEFLNTAHLSRIRSLTNSANELAAAWKYLTKFTGNEKRALIMESGLGGIACSLAKQYKEIYCIHNEMANIECIKSNIGARKINNVFFLQISDLLNLPFKEGSFDTIIIQDFHNLVLSENKDHVDSARFNQVMHNLIKLLTMSGSLTLLFDNRYSYIDWFRNLKTLRFSHLRSIYQNRVGIRSVRKMLKRESFQTVDVYSMNQSSSNSNEIFSSNTPPSIFLAENIRKILGNFFLYSRCLQFFSPSYLVVASRNSIQNLCEKILEHILEKEAKGYFLNKVQIADQKVIISMLSSGSSDGNMVIKLPINDLSYQRCINNRDVIRLLHKENILTDQISRFANSGTYTGQPYFVEEFIDGVVFGSPSQKYISIVGKAFELLVELHQSTLSRTLIDATVYDDILKKQFEDFYGTLNNQYAKNCISDMEKVEEYVRENIIHKQIPLVLFHADYKAENLIFDPKTLSVKGIIDWDLAVTRCLPLLDVIHLLLSKVRVFSGMTLPELIINKAIPVEYNEQEWDYINKYVKALDIDKDLITALSLMYWVHHITYRMIPIMKIHKSWFEDNVYKPLEKIKSLYL